MLCKTDSAGRGFLFCSCIALVTLIDCAPSTNTSTDAAAGAATATLSLCVLCLIDLGSKIKNVGYQEINVF